MAEDAKETGGSGVDVSSALATVALVSLVAAFCAGRLIGPTPFSARRALGVGERSLLPLTLHPLRDTHDRRSLKVAALAMLFAFLAALATGWQAKTAHETLSLQRDFGFRQLRAYVEVLDASARPVPTAGQPFVTRLQLKNAGMTPAYDLMVYNLFATVRVGEIDTVPLVRRAEWPTATSITLGSQQERASPLTSQLRVSQAQLDLYAEGLLAFVSYGRVNYNDVFGHAHHTEYCIVFVQGREAVTCPQYEKAD